MHHRGLHAATDDGPKSGRDMPARPLSLEERVVDLEQRLGAVIAMQDRERSKLDDLHDRVLSPHEGPQPPDHPYPGDEISDHDPRYGR